MRRSIRNNMTPNGEMARELNLQLLKTRMAFRQAVQRLLRKYEIGMTFEMLQILYQLRTLQGVSQQQLAEATARDKACITSLINNLEKRMGATETAPRRPPRTADLPDRRRCPHVGTNQTAAQGDIRPYRSGNAPQADAGVPETIGKTECDTGWDLSYDTCS